MVGGMTPGGMTLVGTGHVEMVEGYDSSYPNDAGAGRIKVRMDSDGNDRTNVVLADAWPLLPKSLHCIPRKGEGVLIFQAEGGRPDSQRFYLGPIISQPQYNEYCEYKYGRGNATSLLLNTKTGRPDPLTSIDRAKGMTKGAYPEPQDVALLGRGQEDIILKYRGRRDNSTASVSEVDIRAGIKLEPSDTSVKYLQGNVIFNSSSSPAYIQVKRSNAGLAGVKAGSGDMYIDKYEGPEKRTAMSVVNVVADKINLISHKDSNQFGEKICDNEELVKVKEMDDIMSNLHRTVYGDELITLLKLMVDAIKTHTHPYSMLPPTEKGTLIEKIDGYEFEKLLSPNVRIS